MSKYVKELLQNELKQKITDVDDFLVVQTKGIDGNANNEMRGALKAKGIKLMVVRNAMMRQALEGLGKTAAVSLFLAGPCTVAYGGDSIVDVAKELKDWGKKISVIALKGAFIEGVKMDAEGAEALAKMPNRVELQGQIVSLARSPGANVAGAVIGPCGALAGCIKSLIEKLEKAA